MQGTGKSSTLNLRMPIWTDSDGAKAALNGQSLPLSAPGIRYNHNMLIVSDFLFLES